KYDRIDDMVEQQSEPGPRHIERLEGRLPDEREGEEDKTEAERPPAYLPRLLAQQRREREDPEHDSHDNAKRPFRRSLDLFLAIEFLMHANPSPHRPHRVIGARRDAAITIVSIGPKEGIRGGRSAPMRRGKISLERATSTVYDAGAIGIIAK